MSVEIKKRIERLAMQIKKDQEKKKILEQKMRSSELNKKRQEDTRRKFLIGSCYLEEMMKNDVLKKDIIVRLDNFLTRDSDRALFNLPTIQKVNSETTKD